MLDYVCNTVRRSGEVAVGIHLFVRSLLILCANAFNFSNINTFISESILMQYLNAFSCKDYVYNSANENRLHSAINIECNCDRLPVVEKFS